MHSTRDRAGFAAVLLGAAVWASAAIAWAQEPPPQKEKQQNVSEEKQESANATPALPRRTPKPGDVTKVFVLRHVGARPLADVLAVFPATISFPAYGSLPTQTIGVSAPTAVMAAIEETIKRLDVEPPPRTSIELTGYVLEGSAQPVEGAFVPEELESVVAQLKRTFSYQSYRLLETLIVRGTENSRFRTEAVGSSDAAGVGRTFYSLSARDVRVLPGETGSTVRLVGLDFDAQVPVTVEVVSAEPSGPKPPRSFQYRTVGVHTDIEIRAGRLGFVGERVVVGKSGTSDPTKAMILVLSARTLSEGGAQPLVAQPVP